MAKAENSEKAVKPNIFMRIGLFIKQIIDELRKVVTRRWSWASTR